MKRLPTKLRNRLIRHRIAKGWILEDVAKRCKVTAATVMNWEHGAIPSARHLVPYMNAIGLPAKMQEEIIKFVTK